MLQSRILVFSLIFGSLSSPVHAIEVFRVKEGRALLNLQGESVKSGEQYEVLDEMGEPVAIVEVDKVKADQAIANIIQGDPKPNQTLIPYIEKQKKSSRSKKQSPKSDPSTQADKESPSKTKKNSESTSTVNKKIRIAGLFGISSQSISLTAENKNGDSADAKLSGSSFNLRVTGAYLLNPQFHIQVSAGLEPVSVSSDVKATNGNLICQDGTASKCEVKITYFAGDALAQYNILPGNSSDSGIRFWIGGGLGLLLATSSELNIPNLKKPSGASYTYILATGADIPVGAKGGYVPFSIDYTLMPGDSVSSSFMNIRAGYGWMF